VADTANACGIIKASGGECVLEGPNIDAMEDNVKGNNEHITPRIRQRDYKWKWQQQV
jgi:hypothetical protein